MNRKMARRIHRVGMPPVGPCEQSAIDAAVARMRARRPTIDAATVRTLARYRDDLPQVYLREIGESWYVCAKGDPGAVLFQPVHP